MSDSGAQAELESALRDVPAIIGWRIAEQVQDHNTRYVDALFYTEKHVRDLLLALLTAQSARLDVAIRERDEALNVCEMQDRNHGFSARLQQQEAQIAGLQTTLNHANRHIDALQDQLLAALSPSPPEHP